MIEINNIHLHIDETENEFMVLKKRIINKIGVSSETPFSFRILKESLDMRQKNNPFFIYKVLVTMDNEEKILKKADKDIRKYREEERLIPEYGNEVLKKRPVVIGFGPAGMFSALTLAKAGLRPVVFEMGPDVVKRTAKVENFWNTGKLDPWGNIQCGEGGAGTFSDGKLTTRIKDRRVEDVIEAFIEAGAPEEIRYLQKPHVGTDILKGVVMNIRKKIISLGGEVNFNSRMEDMRTENGKVRGVRINSEWVETDDVVLCIGHSSRDTYSMMYEKGFRLEPKAFAVGFRAEHLQKDIDENQYGKYKDHKKLKASEYTLAHKLSDGRGVYSFCMCPGGYVVNASSEEGRLCVNGMSHHARNGINANSAIVISVSEADYGSHPLDGMKFQRMIEEKAFRLGGGDFRAPVQYTSDFSGTEKGSGMRAEPQVRPGFVFTDLRGIYSEKMTEGIIEGMAAFGKKIKGFDTMGVFTGVEARTSAPLRIKRNEELQAEGVSGLYPCGEGAGYAGGIVSSAVDGIKCAGKIISRYRKQD